MRSWGSLMRLPRRHPHRFLVVVDALPDQAGIRIFRHDRAAGLTLGDGVFAQVETQVDHSSGRVGTVALKAVFREDRPDVALKVERSSRRGGGIRRRNESQEEAQSEYLAKHLH